MKNRIVSILLAVALLFALAVNASAENSGPDLTQRGSLTFTMELGGEPLTKGNLNLYHVASIEMNEEYIYEFRLIDVLADDELSLENVNDPILADELLRRAKDSGLQSINAPIRDGMVTFQDLPTGLYLVWQGKEDVDQDLMPIQPFVISVPRLQGDVYVLDVVAAPKVPIETEPTQPTTPPPPPGGDLPQTGQMNWPVPVMAVSGAVLMIIGWILCAGRKRSGYEK